MEREDMKDDPQSIDKLGIKDLHSVKLFLEVAYICCCDSKKEVILMCQHGFCVGCIARIKVRANLNKGAIGKLVECPICLAYSKEYKVVLKCGCSFNENRVSNAKKSEANSKNKLQCIEHKRELKATEMMVLFGEISSSIVSAGDIHELQNYGQTITLKLSGTLHAEELKMLEEKIRNSTTIKKLNIKNSDLTKQNDFFLLEILSKNPKLRELDLSGCKINEKKFKAIVDYMLTNSNINVLKLDFVCFCDDDKSSSVISSKEGEQIARMMRSDLLTALSISRHKLDSSATEDIAAGLLANNSLTTLHLENCEIKSADSLLKMLRRNNVLKELSLIFCNLYTEDFKQIDYAMKDNRTLEKLNLSDNYVEQIGSKAIASGINNTIIAELILNNCEIKNEGAEVIALALQSNRYLKILSIKGNKLEDAGAKSMGQMLVKNKTLTDLNLAQNGIGDNGVEEIANGLIKNRTLLKLNLEYNKISDSGAKTIGKAITASKALIEFYFAGNNITETGKSKLRSAKDQNTKRLIKLCIEDTEESDTESSKDYCTIF